MKFKIEKERRFLVKRMIPSSLGAGGKKIIQWYICLKPLIRVRIEDSKDCFLTIKMAKKKGEEYELESEIPRDLLPNFAAARKRNPILKNRYFVGDLELNVFTSSQLAGLVLLEFEEKKDTKFLQIPLDFVVEEVTGDPRFRNHNLARLDSIPEEWRCQIV